MHGSCTAHGTFRPAPFTQSVAHKLIVFPWFQALLHFWNRRYSAVVWMWHGLRKATLTAPKVGRKEWFYWQHLVQVWGGEGRRRLYKQIGEKLLLTTQGVV